MAVRANLSTSTTVSIAEAVQALAVKNGKTVSQQISALLEQALEAQKQLPDDLFKFEEEK